MSLDMYNVCIQTDAPIEEVGAQVVMKICGHLVDSLVELDPAEYKSYVVIENG